MVTNIKVGKKAPDFTLLDTDKKQRKLSEFKGKTTVLAFFPGAFTSVCQKELCTFRGDMSRLNSMGAQVVAVSVDSPYANKGFVNANNLNFPVLSDYDRKIIAKYGIELKNFAGMKGYTAAKRSVFIMDRDGVVRYVWVSDDPGVEPDYGAISKALAEIK